MAKNSTTTVTTPAGFLSFPALHEKSEKGKFEAGIVFTPGTDISQLEQLVEEAKNTLVPDGIPLAAVKSPLDRDGAEKAHLGGNYVEGAKFFTAKSQFKPGMVDNDVNPILDVEEELYAGAVVRLLVHAYYFDKDGNRGIAFGLDGVQKMGAGERIGGNGIDVTQVFDKVEVEDLLA